MKKRNTKKGFTLVELVIVIAVIAILAGVLIPTFSNVVTNAQESAAKQKAANAFKEDYAEAMADDGKITDDECVKDGKNGFKSVNAWEWTGDGYTFTYSYDSSNNVWKGPTKN